MPQSSKRALFVLVTVLVLTGAMEAQEPASYSTSGIHSAVFDEIDMGGSALPAAPAPQYGQSSRNGQPSKRSIGHLSFELGGGFNAPIGNDIPYITWGGNLTLGVGRQFRNHTECSNDLHDHGTITGVQRFAAQLPSRCEVRCSVVTIGARQYAHASRGRYRGCIRVSAGGAAETLCNGGRVSRGGETPFRRAGTLRRRDREPDTTEGCVPNRSTDPASTAPTRRRDRLTAR